MKLPFYQEGSWYEYPIYVLCPAEDLYWISTLYCTTMIFFLSWCYVFTLNF